MGFGTVGIYFGWVGTVISTIFYVTGPAPPYFKLIQGKVSVNDVPGPGYYYDEDINTKKIKIAMHKFNL